MICVNCKRILEVLAAIATSSLGANMLFEISQVMQGPDEGISFNFAF